MVIFEYFYIFLSFLKRNHTLSYVQEDKKDCVEEKKCCRSKTFLLIFPPAQLHVQTRHSRASKKKEISILYTQTQNSIPKQMNANLILIQDEMAYTVAGYSTPCSTLLNDSILIDTFAIHSS